MDKNDIQLEDDNTDTAMPNPLDFDHPWVPTSSADRLETKHDSKPAPRQDRRAPLCCDAAHYNEAGGICCTEHYGNTCGYDHS